MYWEETKQQPASLVTDDILDVVFGITCRTLPVDHAYALSEALRERLPWLTEEPGAGMHPVHVAASGNGWMRPEGADDLLYLSRRTKLVLRVPKHRVPDAEALVGQTLDVQGHALTVNNAATRPLSDQTTIFSRHLVIDAGQDEEAFLEAAAQALRALDITPKKMLPGRGTAIRTPQRVLHTLSLMLADLEVEESVRLQQRGLGEHRHLGCGLFIPHKGIKEVHDAQGR